MDVHCSQGGTQIHTLPYSARADSIDDPAKEGHSPTGYPHRTAVILATRRKGAGEPEYRIGVVEAGDFSTGLSCKNYKARRLSAVIARKCFGKSRVYYDKAEALADAKEELLPRSSCGIKVLHFEDVWPGVSCALPES